MYWGERRHFEEIEYYSQWHRRSGHPGGPMPPPPFPQRPGASGPLGVGTSSVCYLSYFSVFVKCFLKKCNSFLVLIDLPCV